MNYFNGIEMDLRMHSNDDRRTLVIQQNQDTMCVTMGRIGTKTGGGDWMVLTYEEVDELCHHLTHVVHGPAYVPVQQHLDELDLIDATLGVDRKDQGDATD